MNTVEMNEKIDVLRKEIKAIGEKNQKEILELKNKIPKTKINCLGPRKLEIIEKRVCELAATLTKITQSEKQIRKKLTGPQELLRHHQKV